MAHQQYRRPRVLLAGETARRMERHDDCFAVIMGFVVRLCWDKVLDAARGPDRVWGDRQARPDAWRQRRL